MASPTDARAPPTPMAKSGSNGMPDTKSIAPTIAPVTIVVPFSAGGPTDTVTRLVAAATFTLLAETDQTLDRVLFEVVSAFGTVGLSTGITPDVPGLGQILLGLLMFAGRVGPLTLALFQFTEKITGI